MAEYKPRELAGAINRAKTVFVYVAYGDDENAFCWLRVSKEQAREIVDDAKDEDIETICADEQKGDLYIGDVDFDDDEEDEEEDPEEPEVEREEEEPNLPPMGV